MELVKESIVTDKIVKKVYYCPRRCETYVPIYKTDRKMFLYGLTSFFSVLFFSDRISEKFVIAVQSKEKKNNWPRIHYIQAMLLVILLSCCNKIRNMPRLTLK